MPEVHLPASDGFNYLLLLCSCGSKEHTEMKLTHGKDVGRIAKAKFSEDSNLNDLIKEQQDEFVLKKHLTYFSMGLTGLSFLFVLVLITLYCIGKINLPYYIVVPLITGTVGGGAAVLNRVVKSLFPSSKK
jgi:hypothetical protein